MVRVRVRLRAKVSTKVAWYASWAGGTVSEAGLHICPGRQPQMTVRRMADSIAGTANGTRPSPTSTTG